MGGGCCQNNNEPAVEPGWRRALWIALVVNAGMFGVELYAGAVADSHALKADALDFFGDSANYAISLLVAGLALGWRARAALVKGATLALLGGYVLFSAVGAALHGSSPEPEAMGAIGLLALAANIGVALMLFRFRGGDANMRSVWICSRNDAIGNVAVVAAAAGVFGTGTAWPDLVVAATLALLGLSGGWQIIRQALGELKDLRRVPLQPAERKAAMASLRTTRLLGAFPMRRLISLLTILMLVGILSAESPAHAAEAIGCEIGAAGATDHVEACGDENPADPDKPAIHHHASCHGHCVAVPTTFDTEELWDEADRLFPSASPDPLGGSGPNMALRPPIA